MRRLLTLPLLVCASLLLAVPAPGQPATDLTVDQLASTIRDTIDAPTYAGGSWGIQIANLRTGEVVFSRNEDQNFIPASNVKLYTSAAVLDRLGPDFQYRTRVYIDGPIENGVLKGNVIIRGAGDPTIGGEAQQDDVTRVFRAWADSLRSLGIRRITGDVVGDDTYFSDAPLGRGWSWDDTAYAYSAEIGALSFNLNKINLRVRGGSSIDDPGRIDWSPFSTDYVRVENRSRTVRRWKDKDEEYERLRGTNTIVVGTKVPAGSIEEEELAIANPTLYTAHVFREVLLREKISVAGKAVDLDATTLAPRYDAPATRPVASYTSNPMSDIVRDLNRESINLYAEMMLRTLAVIDPPDSTEHKPGTSELGAAAVHETLGAAGVDTSRVKIVDGSGLSRQNLMTPRGTVQLLQYMWTHPNPAVSTAFFESLAVGGRHGTLERRFRGGAPASENVHAKTGTLSGVSALSGFVTTSRGTPFAFSMFCNNYTADGSEVRDAQDVIVNALARLSR